MEDTVRKLKLFLFEISNGLDVLIEEEESKNINKGEEGGERSSRTVPLLKSFGSVITEAISILLVPSTSFCSSLATQENNGKPFIERLRSSLPSLTAPTVIPNSTSKPEPSPPQIEKARIVREKNKVIDFASTEVAVLRGKLEMDIDLKCKAGIRKKVMSMSERAMLEALRTLTDEVCALTDAIAAREREALRERLELDKKLYMVRVLEERLGPDCYDTIKHFPVLPAFPTSSDVKLKKRRSGGSSSGGSGILGGIAHSKALSYEEIPMLYGEQSSSPSSSSSIDSPKKSLQQNPPSPSLSLGSPKNPLYSPSPSSSFSSIQSQRSQQSRQQQQQQPQRIPKASSSVGSPQKSRHHSMPKELPSAGQSGSYAQRVFYRHWSSNVPEGGDQAVFTRKSLDKVFTSLGYSLPQEQVDSALEKMSPSTLGVISWPVFNQYMTSFVNSNKQNITKKYVL